MNNIINLISTLIPLRIPELNIHKRKNNTIFFMDNINNFEDYINLVISLKDDNLIIDKLFIGGIYKNRGFGEKIAQTIKYIAENLKLDISIRDASNGFWEYMKNKINLNFIEI